VSSDDFEEEDDTWDDTALIDAYDKAVGLAMQEVQRRMEVGNDPSEQQNGTKKKQKKKTSQKKQAANPKKLTGLVKTASLNIYPVIVILYF